MDKCKLTSDQIRDLLSGQSVRISYDVRIIYPTSEIVTREIELMPEPLRCVECQHFLEDDDDSELCDPCCDKYMGSEN